MQRPLKKRVSADLNWTMSVQEMPHVSGLSYPVFEWSFGQEDGIRGGELRAFAPQGMLVFQERRSSKDWKFESVEEALKKIDEYGWGEPPHIDEVFQDVLETQSKLPAESQEEVAQIFKELRQKWNALVASATS